MSELAEVLEKTFSQDPKDQQYAMMLLQQATEGNFPEYIRQLAEVLVNVYNKPYIRKSAGLQLKNTLATREQSMADKNKTRWLSLPLEVRDYVKKCILQTLGTEPRPSTAAQCIAAIACVEFPLRQWPDLIDCLSANVTATDHGCQSNPLLKESSLEALGYICLDMPEKQKVAPILAAIVHGLRTEEASIHVKLAATKALSEIVDWVMTRTLEEHVDAIVDVICAYLQTAELNLYEEAAKCLYKIASRKFAKTTETPIVLSLFRDEPMRQILTAANLAAADSSSSPEHYKYLKALCDLLCALGIHLAEVWSYVMKTPPNFSLYLSALSSFFMHPSIYIRAETAQVLATFCGHERISKNEDFLRIVPNLIQFLPKAMTKSCSPIPDQDLTAHYSRMDYENEIELQREYIRLREHCLRMIRESATDHFGELLMVIRDWILNRCVANTRDVKSDEWEVMKRQITAVLQASFQLELATAEIRQEYLKLFDAVLQCSVAVSNTSSPTLLNGVLSILSALYPIFDDFPERIPVVLNHLKAILLVDNPNNQDIEVTATKRHSIALLLKIVSVFPGPVKPYARIVFDLVAEVSERVSMMQRANLVHVLAALSNLADALEDQTNFLRNAIQYDVKYIQQEPFSSSPVDFLTHSGLTSMPDPVAISSQNCPYYQGRLNLKASLTALEGVLNQVNVPPDEQSSMKIFDLFIPIIPKFFQFSKSLNSIYMPQYSGQISPAYGLSVLEMAPSERQTLVSSIAVDSDNDGNGKKAEEYEPGQTVNGVGSTDLILYLRKFISEISDLIVSIIGLIFVRFPNNIYSIPSASELISGTLCAIEYVPSFRLRFWVRKTWNRMVTSCPVQYGGVILPLMTVLINHLQKRLVQEWAIVVNQRQSNEEDDRTEEELIAESTMSLLSRECAFFMCNFILGDTFSMKNVKKETPPPLTPISSVLMNDRDMFLAIIGLLAKLITCPDSQATIKSLPAMNILIYSYNHAIDEQMAVNLLVHGIQSLQMFSNDELAAGPILSLIFNIYAQLRPKYPSLLEVLKQVPTCLSENIESFDQRIMTLTEAEESKFHDKVKRDLMRKVLTSTKSRAYYRKASSEANGIEEDRGME